MDKTVGRQSIVDILDDIPNGSDYDYYVKSKLFDPLLKTILYLSLFSN